MFTLTLKAMFSKDNIHKTRVEMKTNKNALQ